MSWTLGFLPVFLLLLGFPIFLVLLTAATATLVLFMNVPLMVLQQTLFASVNVYALLALPFFIFAGEIMDRGSIAERLVGLVSASIGKVPGKIPVTAVGAGAIFGAISGVGAASVATVGKVMYPSMKNAGYNDGFSSGLLVSPIHTHDCLRRCGRSIHPPALRRRHRARPTGYRAAHAVLLLGRAPKS